MANTFSLVRSLSPKHCGWSAQGRREHDIGKIFYTTDARGAKPDDMTRLFDEGSIDNGRLAVKRKGPFS